MPRKKKRVKIEEAKTDVADEVPAMEFVVIPPDGGWGWMVVFAAFLSNMVVDGTIYTFGIFLTEITLNMNSTESDVSWANSILTGFYYMCGPFVCAAANRCGFRVVAVFGSAIGCISLGLASVVTTVPLYIVAYGVIGGIGFAMTYIANILVVGFYFERWRALATAIAVCGSSVGTIIIPPVFNIVLIDYNWRVKYRVLCTAAFLAGLLTIVYKPIIPSRILTEREKKEEDTISVSVNDDNPRSIFYKRHNTAYPTNAELVAKTSYTIQSDRDYQDAGTSASKSSFKSYRTWLTKQSSMSFFSGRPVLNDERLKRPKCMHSHCCFTESVQRPMYKDDIMFTGSVATLPQYDRTKVEKAQASLEYHMSITRVTTVKDFEEGKRCCICCPQAVQRTLATMLDLSLLKSPSFCLLAISGLFTYLGFYTPYLYIINYAEAKNVSKEKATFLISTMGISNGIGRLATGIVAVMPKGSALVITYVSLIFTGLATTLVIYAYEEYTFFTFAVVYGLSTACLASLRPIIIVDMYGLEKLTNAIGILVLFMGISALIGAPIASLLREATDSYESPFLFAGTAILLGCLLLFPLKSTRDKEIKKAMEVEKEEKLRKQEETRQKLAEINKPNKPIRKK